MPRKRRTAEIRPRKKEVSVIEMNGEKFYNNGAMADYIQRSESTLFGYQVLFKERTGIHIDSLRFKDRVSNFISERNLFKFIIVLQDKIGFVAAPIIEQHPDLVKEVQEMLAYAKSHTKTEEAPVCTGKK